MMNHGDSPQWDFSNFEEAHKGMIAEENRRNLAKTLAERQFAMVTHEEFTNKLGFFKKMMGGNSGTGTCAACGDEEAALSTAGVCGDCEVNMYRSMISPSQPANRDGFEKGHRCDECKEPCSMCGAEPGEHCECG